MRCLLLLLAISCVWNSRASSPKLSIDSGTKDLNHTLADPLKVSGKAL